MAGTALSVLGLIQPTVIDLLRKGMQNRDDINKLLRNESTMEIVIRGLKEMLDGLEGNGSSDGSDDFLRELFDEFKKSVRALHGEMQQIREAYPNDQSRLRFLGLSPQDHRRSRKLRKLQDHFTDVVEKTDLMRKCAELITRQGGGGGSGSRMHVDPVGVDTNSIADTPRVRSPGRQLQSLSTSQVNRQTRGHRHGRAYENPSRKDLSQTHQDMEKAIYRRQRQGKCRNCGWLGHWEYRCRERCGKCGRTGHKVSGCEGNVVCFSCGGVGHMHGDCPSN